MTDLTYKKAVSIKNEIQKCTDFIAGVKSGMIKIVIKFPDGKTGHADGPFMDAAIKHMQERLAVMNEKFEKL